jgi:dihydropteroate synthase
VAELVGILNLTPDSFSDGGAHDDPAAAVRHAGQLYAQGAALVDIGAESTRPGAVPLSWEQEAGRLEPVLTEIAARRWALSLDSYHPETVSWAHGLIGHFLINDVTGFASTGMREVAAETALPVVVGHLPLTAQGNIQKAHRDEPVDSVDQVVDELNMRIAQLVWAGVDDEQIIVDPGIGFGKTMRTNWELLRVAERFRDRRVMVGYSRKRFLGKRRMEIRSNLEAGRIAIDSGAAYLRVHEVAPHLALIGS